MSILTIGFGNLFLKNVGCKMFLAGFRWWFSPTLRFFCVNLPVIEWLFLGFLALWLDHFDPTNCHATYCECSFAKIAAVHFSVSLHVTCNNLMMVFLTGSLQESWPSYCISMQFDFWVTLHNSILALNKIQK